MQCACHKAVGSHSLPSRPRLLPSADWVSWRDLHVNANRDTQSPTLLLCGYPDPSAADVEGGVVSAQAAAQQAEGRGLQPWGRERHPGGHVPPEPGA